MLMILLSIVATLISCKSKQKLVSNTQTARIEIEEVPIVHDIVIPRDSAVLRMPIIIDRDVGKPKPTKASAKGKRSSVDVEITDKSELIVQANCDEYKEQVELMQRTIREYEQSIEVYEQQESALTKLTKNLKTIIIAILCIAGVWFIIPKLKNITNILK